MSFRSPLKKTVLAAIIAVAVPVGAGTPAEAAPSVCNRQLPRTSTESDGVPGTNFWKLLQCYAADGGYSGPIDGDLGRNSWVGVERHLKGQLFYSSGSFPGVLDQETTRGLERFGGHYGSGRATVNGSLGPEDYRDIAQALNNKYGA
ncbi:hypothetical protein EDF54_0687 [Rathayibacter sp. PhB93]|nr:hypothetical protein EDF54_0687 [Rathayibacter sp. PhB93]TDQ15759.1 hypothetical protein EDF17_0432 [Rathayibacter sp. PhB1]